MKSCFVLLASLLPLAGQTQEYHAFRLDNGARIGYQIWNGVESRPGEKSVSQVEESGNMIRRTLLNRDGTPWLGFEVHIDKASSADFLVWFAPAAGFPYFAQNPLPRHIRDGDRVMLDVLEQPGTGKKVFDLFQVSVNAQHTPIPLPMDSIPSVIPPGTSLRLSHPSLTLGGVHVPSAQATAVSSASQLSVDVPRVGRFSFSSAPLPGYLLDAVAENGGIEVAGDDHYRVECDAAVVDKPGSWFLWVRFEPSPRTAPASAAVVGPPPLAVTATPAGAGEDGSQPGLLLNIKNVSGKNVLAYALQLRYTNPDTGQSMGSGGHSAFRHGTAGPPQYLAPAQTDTDPKPISLPHTSDGVTATYVISVDLVVFEDGSQWGPASSRGAQQLLQRIQASGVLK
jgi:hypothetical protein